MDSGPTRKVSAIRAPDGLPPDPRRTVASTATTASTAAAEPRATTPILQLALASLVLVPLGILVFGAWLAWGQVWRQAEAELARTADAAAEYAAHLLDGHVLLVDRIDDLLRGLSDEQIRESEADLHARLLRIARARPSVQTLYATDAEGLPLVSAELFPVPRRADIRGRDFFKALHGAGTPEVFISKVYLGEFDGQLLFSVAERRGAPSDVEAAPQNAPFRGVVLVSLRLGEVAMGLRQLTSEPGDTIALVRTDGELLARSPAFDRPPSPLSASSPILPVMAANAERAVVRGRSTIDGGERVAAFRRVGGWPVYASASRKRAAIVARWRGIVAWQAGFGVPAAFALVGLVGFAFKRSRDVAEVRAGLRVDAERRASAEALGESEARLRAATEGAGLGIYEFDFAHRAIWLDARAAALLDDVLPPGVWLPFDAPDLVALTAHIHPEDRASRAAVLSSVADGTADSLALEYRIRRADGGWKWIWSHGTPFERDPVSGEPQRLIGVIRDITETHRLEADLHQAQKLQALGELAGGIAHDFNNVLQTVAGSAALIEQSAEDFAIVRRRARMVADAAERGASTTRRLLAFARRSDLRAESVDPAELLRGLREILAPALGASIAIRVEAEVGLRPMLVDKGQLETALVNLATNARDAMPDGGMLTLSATEQKVAEGDATRPVASLMAGRYICLSVRDTGKGMDTALLARVGEPFFTTKPAGQGTGLGLPMVKGFAEQSGGAFMVESEPGQGTTVMLWFPQAGGGATLPTTSRTAATNLGRANSPQILVVDDEPAVCETLVDMLKAAGYAVRAAANGTEAVARLDAGEKVDALVTDLTMPGMDGLALIREARERRPGLPVVLLTGYVGDIAALAVGSAQGGPFSLLRKPIFGAQLADRVAALLAATANSTRTADVGIGGLAIHAQG